MRQTCRQDNFASDRILRLPEVIRLTGMSRSTILSWSRCGTFPSKVVLGPRSVGWSERAVQTWIADRFAPVGAVVIEMRRLGKARVFACDLSRIVRTEADAMRAEARAAEVAINPAEIRANLVHPRLAPLREGETGHKAFDLGQIAKALDKWSAKCEMRGQQDAALGILKDLLKVDVSQIDSNPWLLNCANGTVDLRTGVLRPHDPTDLITKITSVSYDPDAKAPRFRQFLNEIFNTDRLLIEFLARWFGYCATGDVSSQAFLIHWGCGSNGKGVLIETIASALGDYATPATLGLLTSKDDVHLSEIADLHGKRLVTASESDEGARLRESLLKQATGGDRLKGRHLYGQLFEFLPTHKLQLLTNHKPQILGTDHAIWRRIHLVPYLVTFGTEGEVAGGLAQSVKDEALVGTLKSELPGILAWLVAAEALSRISPVLLARSSPD